MRKDYTTGKPHKVPFNYNLSPSEYHKEPVNRKERRAIAKIKPRVQPEHTGSLKFNFLAYART